MPRVFAVTRARKHGDHDQSDHGNWATGGGSDSETPTRVRESLSTSDSYYPKELDLRIGSEDSNRVDVVKEMYELTPEQAIERVQQERADFQERRITAVSEAIPKIAFSVGKFQAAGGTISVIDAEDSTDEIDQLMTRGTISEQNGMGFEMISAALIEERVNPQDTTLYLARNAEGTPVGALAARGGYVSYLGSTGEMYGVGSALMYGVISDNREASDNNYISLGSMPNAGAWYEKYFGMADVQAEQLKDGYYADSEDRSNSANSSHYLTSDEADTLVREVDSALKASTKSIKHGDHDQSDHGNRDGESSAPKDDYRMQHKAPSRTDDVGSSADQIEEMMPNFYEHPEFYRTGDSKSDNESVAVVQRIKDNPDAFVTLYRAVPKGVAGINPGDWVTLSPSYAQGHNESNLGGEGRIVSIEARAKDLWFDGNSINEWGYDPVSAGAKSTKHADHDQSEHGNWATGGARLNKYDGKFKESGGTLESKTVVTPKDSQSERGKIERLLNKVIDQRDEVERGSDEDKELKTIIEGYRMMDLAFQSKEDYASNTAVITAKDSNGKIVGALSYYAPGDGPQLTVQFLGTSHEVSGTGTALMREVMQIALDGNKTFAVLEPSEKAQPWYESLGLGPLVTRHDSLGGERELYTADPDKLKEILGSTVKSIKHGDHDQSTHGNRDEAGESSAPQTVSGIIKLATESKGGAELLTKVLESRGVSMKPVIGDMTPENGKQIYRGFTDDKYARQFIAGEDKVRAGYSIAPGEKLTPYTWGAGVYATSEWEEAKSYAKDEGMVVAMQFAPGARIVQGEGMWTDVPGMPKDWDGQEWGKYTGTISDLHNAYWAAQGYDAIDFGREVIILNPGAVTVDIYSADRAGVDVGWPKMPGKSIKHLDGEHDQSDHGSWATGITSGTKLPAAEFAAKLVARAAESRDGKSGIQQLDLSNTSSFAEIKSASDTITSAIDKEMGKWPSMYAEPRVEPTEQQKFLKQFSDGADLMRNTLYSANEGEIGRNKDFQFFVATGVDGTTPVGTLVYRNFTRENVGNNPYLTGHEDKWMELTNIGTNGLEPGVGTRLVTQVLGAAAESGRGVWLNDPYDEAVGFYKELGFEMKYKQGDWIGYMEPETVQEWWKSYEAAGGK